MPVKNYNIVEKLEKTNRGKDLFRDFMEKLEQTIKKNKGNKELNNNQTDNYCIQQLTKN